MPVPAAPFDRLFNDIKLAIPGAIDAVIYQELWRVFEDFFDGTNAWIEEIPVLVTPNVLTYTVTPAGKGCINRLMMVYDPATASPDKRWVQGSIQFLPPDKIRLMYSPSTAKTWIAACSMNIQDPPVNGLPDIDADAVWIIDRYRDAFRFGTLGYMMMQGAKPYSNAKLASYNWQNYVAERGRARSDALHANVYGGQRWMYPQGYATTARKGWT